MFFHFVSTDRHSLSFDCSGCHSVQKEEQQQFWVDITDMSKAQAAAACDVLISSREEMKEFYIEGGSISPSVSGLPAASMLTASGSGAATPT